MTAAVTLYNPGAMQKAYNQRSQIKKPDTLRPRWLGLKSESPQVKRPENQNFHYQTTRIEGPEHQKIQSQIAQNKKHGQKWGSCCWNSSGISVCCRDKMYFRVTVRHVEVLDVGFCIQADVSWGWPVLHCTKRSNTKGIKSKRHRKWNPKTRQAWSEKEIKSRGVKIKRSEV